MVIGGDKFFGKPGDWADIKTESVSAIAAAGYHRFSQTEPFGGMSKALLGFGNPKPHLLSESQNLPAGQ